MESRVPFISKTPAPGFKFDTLGGAISSDVKERFSASHLPLSGRVSSMLGIALPRGCSSRNDRSDAQSYCASRGHKPLRKLSGPCFRRLANGLLRRRKFRAPPATKRTGMILRTASGIRKAYDYAYN